MNQFKTQSVHLCVTTVCTNHSYMYNSQLSVHSQLSVQITAVCTNCRCLYKSKLSVQITAVSTNHNYLYKLQLSVQITPV